MKTSCENKNESVINGIMNGTDKTSSKKGCKGIGKVWKRNCPKCGKELVYINKKSFNQICKNNSPCISCCQIGKEHPHTEAHKEYMKSLMTGREITWKDKIRKNHWSNNPSLRKRISEKQSKLICGMIESGIFDKKNKNFKTGYCLNEKTGIDEFYRSSYELLKMKKLNSDVSVKFWTTKHKIRIPYVVNETTHFYIPDFLIELTTGRKILEETKGYIENKNLLKLKIRAAKKYCKINGIDFKICYEKPKL